MGTEVKSQGIGPVLLEEGIIKMCYLLPCGFLLWTMQSPGVARGAAQGHELTQLLVGNFSPS